MYSSAATALAALVLLVAPTTAHSWVEEMDVIDPKTGTFTGTPGYCRNNTKRTAPGFSDPLMVHILPSAGQPAIEERDTIPALDTTGIYPNDTMCKRSQQAQYQSNGSPRLQASPGDLVALRYQENGHVTIPSNQPGKQLNRGTVYIYGTTQPATPELFLNVFGQWNENSTGGDKRGVLLATQSFDDGYCYQVNGGNISTHRQAQFPHTPNQLMGANLWCQNDIALPTDIPTGKPYTLYWVWDWPTEPGVDPNLPKGKAELYSTCMDLDIVAQPGSKRRVKARQAPSPASQSALDHLNSAAIPAYVSSLTASPVPAGASQAVSAPDSAASPYVSSLTASAAPAGPSPTVSAQVSPASPESTITPSASPSVVANPANPAAQVIDYNSMTNAGEASYIENAVSAAIVAEAPKVPLTVTVDIVESVISPTAPGAAGAAAATQPASAPASTPVASPAYVAPASAPVASPAYVAPASSPAASPASMAPAATQAASPASASTPPTASTPTPAQAPANAVSSMPPDSLEINPPILSASPSTSTTVSLQGLSGTATPVAASPAVAATSVLAAGASKSPVIASGPATNSTAPVMASGSSQNGTVAAKGQRGCSATTCKSKRQSKIFGK